MKQGSAKRIFLITLFGILMCFVGFMIRPNTKHMGILKMESYFYEESEKRLLEAYEKNPEDLVTLKVLAQIYEILGRPEMVIRYLSEYIELRPKDTSTRLHLAKVFLWNLKQRHALEQYVAILEYEPENVDVLRKLAETYTWEQQHSEAIDCYRRIARIETLRQDDMRALIQLYIATTQLDEALTLAENMHRLFKDDLDYKDYLHIADLYSWTGRPALADTTLHRMVTLLKPETWEARLAFVDWYIYAGRSNRAITRCKQWIEKEDKFQLPSHEKLVEL